jgi:phospholipid/cholesterol/gamma-HCH transport system substrate-binding protein
MRTRIIELAVGLFMVAGIAALCFLAMKASGLAEEADKPSYQVHASFQNAGGLTLRAKVTMAGVVIGRVTDIRLDPKTLKARVTMSIHKDVNEITTDSVASILTAGLLGEKYIGISIGGEEQVLADGGVIRDTQSALVLEDLIGKFLLNSVNKEPAKQ